MGPQETIARRIAKELAPGMLVNLGIGIPTQVANYVPKGMHVFFQSENGLIGTGAPPEEGMAHPTLTDAGGSPVTALPGASTFGWPASSVNPAPRFWSTTPVPGATTPEPNDS